jgi:hypothetical protein
MSGKTIGKPAFFKKATVKKAVAEKDIEAYLVREVAKLGGTAYKFSSPQRRAVPDRLCVLPKGVSIFIECKRPGMKLTPAQNREMERLIILGHQATWVDSFEEVDSVLKLVSEMLKRGDDNE